MAHLSLSRVKSVFRSLDKYKFLVILYLFFVILHLYQTVKALKVKVISAHTQVTFAFALKKSAQESQICGLKYKVSFSLSYFFCAFPSPPMTILLLPVAF